MVPNRINNLRILVPILGILALAALFFKLPEATKHFGFFSCKTCLPGDPYLPLIGAGYFSVLVAISLLFPAFPRKRMARGGLIWAVLLAFAMTYQLWPSVCPLCLFTHACHIAIWSIWASVPAIIEQSRNIRLQLCLTVFAPIAVVALFSSLNLTFMAYGFLAKSQVFASGLRPGDAAPAFFEPDKKNLLLINFVSPNCPYCEKQLTVLQSLSPIKEARIINISPKLTPDLIQRLPTAEWLEDTADKMRELFQVYGYPTLFIVGIDGKIAKIIPGAPNMLKENLLSSLSLPTP